MTLFLEIIFLSAGTYCLVFRRGWRRWCKYATLRANVYASVYPIAFGRDRELFRDMDMRSLFARLFTRRLGRGREADDILSSKRAVMRQRDREEGRCEGEDTTSSFNVLGKPDLSFPNV